MTTTEEAECKVISEWIRLANHNPIAKSIIARKLREIIPTVTDESKRRFLKEQLWLLTGETE